MFINNFKKEGKEYSDNKKLCIEFGIFSSEMVM